MAESVSAESVSIAALCPVCDAKLKVRSNRVGRTARCPNCSSVILLRANDASVEENKALTSTTVEISCPGIPPTSENDPRLSEASHEQIMESLEARGTAAVLITMPFDQIESFAVLRGVAVRVQSAKVMKDEDIASVLIAIAVRYHLMLGLALPSDLLGSI